jgi:hypothetical protein
MRRVRWFSDGAASAVATKLDIQQHGVEAGPVVICDTNNEDEDNYRFRAECEAWFGCPVTVIKSEKYDSVWDVWQRVRYISGHKGAPCSREMKFTPRLNFEEYGDINVFGYTADRSDSTRADRLKAEFLPGGFETPLIVRGITKANCLALLSGAGIAMPRSYGMGFPNANCLETGCGKAQSPRYWALYRFHFPDRFAKTAAFARSLGVQLAVMREWTDAKGKRHVERGYIDDIPADYPTTEAIAPTCDLLCSINAKDLAA